VQCLEISLLTFLVGSVVVIVVWLAVMVSKQCLQQWG